MLISMCRVCGDDVPRARWALGYYTCLPCGEAQARQRKHCAVPLNKSAYMLVTDPATLTQLNPKRTS